MNDAIIDLPSAYQRPPEYAGFWIRVAAMLMDCLLIYVLVLIISVAVMVVGIAQPAFFNLNSDYNPTGRKVEVAVIIYVLIFITLILYFPMMESSAKQGTFGKMIVGIKVGDKNRNKISFTNALGRFFSKLISSMILCIGYMMVGWTEKKQGLHDMMADTIVFYKRRE